MSKVMDLVGKRFGKLTVIARSGVRANNGQIKWVSKCDCGNIKTACGFHLRGGVTKSCGCLVAENKYIKHGYSGTPEYRAYYKMKDRCYDINDKEFHCYGGRGIRVCERWLGSFEAFLSDIGKRPSSNHSLDRFPDTNGNYEPTNCRWATCKEQSRNKTCNRWIVYKGEKHILADWALKVGMDVRNLHSLLKRESFEQFMMYYEKYGIIDRRTMPKIFYNRKKTK